MKASNSKLSRSRANFLADDRLTRKDIVSLGRGGLLKEAPERGTPREVKQEDIETESTISMIPSSE